MAAGFRLWWEPAANLLGKRFMVKKVVFLVFMAVSIFVASAAFFDQSKAIIECVWICLRGK